MKIRAYSPRTGNLLADDITGIYFGNIRQGEHSIIPIVISPLKTTEDTFTEMTLFLQNNGGYNSSEFGHLVSDAFISDVRSFSISDYTPGRTYICDHFVLNPTASGEGGVTIEDENYIWLDVQVGALETGSTSNINYRFVFDYF